MSQDLTLLKKSATSEVGYFLPPFETIAATLKLPDGKLPEKDVTIPVDLLRLLLRGWLVNQKFDEAAYRKANPDVDQAITDGALQDGWSHYVENGYFEGRSPGVYHVDPKFYRRTYPDVALAERRGQLTVQEHFTRTGLAEGRVGSETHARMVQLWKEALGTD